MTMDEHEGEAYVAKLLNDPARLRTAVTRPVAEIEPEAVQERIDALDAISLRDVISRAHAEFWRAVQADTSARSGASK